MPLFYGDICGQLNDNNNYVVLMARRRVCLASNDSIFRIHWHSRWVFVIFEIDSRRSEAEDDGGQVRDHSRWFCAESALCVTIDRLPLSLIAPQDVR